jgi:hypothetical protein
MIIESGNADAGKLNKKLILFTYDFASIIFLIITTSDDDYIFETSINAFLGW